MFGSLITIVIGLITSFLLGANKLENMDTMLLSPCVRRWVDRYKARRALKNGALQQTKTPAKALEMNKLKLAKLSEKPT